MNGELLSKAELDMAYLQTDVYRKRLMCISDFMQLLNQYIARQSNIEDDVTGHFWQARFKSQALLDERALLTCTNTGDLGLHIYSSENKKQRQQPTWIWKGWHTLLFVRLHCLS